MYSVGDRKETVNANGVECHAEKYSMLEYQ